MKYKIGQVIQFKKDFVIQTENSGKLTVKSGDQARVVRRVDDNTGEIVYTTGEAKGKSQNIKIQVDNNIDGERIAAQILREIYE